MKYYLIAAIAYLCLAVLIVLVTRENGVWALQTAWNKTVNLAPIFGQIVVGLIAAGIVMTRVTQNGTLRAVITSVVCAFIATLFFHSGFTLIKTSMPYIVPFYADIALANWDAALHGGHDPWALTHGVADYLHMHWFGSVYLNIWALPAICLPVIMAATDKNRERVLRTMVLYIMAWVLIGNILALAGMSAGPIFYDRIYGGERFADLTAVFDAGVGITEYFLPIQNDLWMAYSTSEQSIGTGISAFPSVHLSISMVTALYLYERSRWLGVVGAMFVVVILFLSVYSGYHYAIDGYFSIAVMWGAWALMRRRATKPLEAPMPVGQLA